MQQSESIKEIYGALVKALGEISNPQKNAENPHFKNRYADLSSIIEMARPVLLAHGLAVIQGSETDGRKVTVKTRIIHLSGEWVENSVTMEAAGTDPQKIGSALTYGRRYGLSAILNIAADDDDDGEANRGKPAQKTPQTSPKQDKTLGIKKAVMAEINLAGIPKDEAEMYVQTMAESIGIGNPLSEMSEAEWLDVYNEIKTDCKARRENAKN